MAYFRQKCFLLSMGLLCFLLSFDAQANFRKALEALQKQDHTAMLAEVQEAVEKKNDDGLILFISALEMEHLLATNKLFLLSPQEREQVNDALAKGIYVTPWKNALGEKGIEQLYQLLETATKRSSLESQFRYIGLRYLDASQFVYSPRNSQDYKRFQENKRKYFVMQGALVEKGYANAAMDFYYRSLEDKQPVKAIEWLNKAASLGHTEGMLLLGKYYLIGDTGKGVIKDEVKGMKLLKEALAAPDADFYYDTIANDLAGHYLEKNNAQSLDQAYSWSLVALTHSRSGLVPANLIRMKKNGLLAKVAPAFDLAWTETFNKMESHLKRYDLDIYNNYGIESLPTALKDITKISMPKLIRDNQKVDLKVEPAISFHNFNYGTHFSLANAVVVNYLIDIYEDGHVNFTIGPKISRDQNIGLFIKLTPQEVESMKAVIRNYAFEETALITNSKHARGCGLANCDDLYPNRIAAYGSSHYITIRDTNQERTIRFNARHGDPLPAFFAGTFRLIEEKLHTQEYRCGNLKTREYYQYCLSRDMNF